MDQKEAWLTATIIHCDICRLLVAYEECELDGIARLLWLGDIASKLYEARTWFHQIGNQILINLPDESGSIRQRLKELSRLYPLNDLEEYKRYRHKIGHHYSQEIGQHLHAFSTSEAERFFNLITNMIHYAREWAVLYKNVIRASGQEA